MLSPICCHSPYLCLRHQCQVVISFQLLIYLLKNAHLLLSSFYYAFQLSLPLLIHGAVLVMHWSDELEAICGFTAAEAHLTCTSVLIEPSALEELLGQNLLACCCSIWAIHCPFPEPQLFLSCSTCPEAIRPVSQGSKGRQGGCVCHVPTCDAVQTSTCHLFPQANFKKPNVTQFYAHRLMCTFKWLYC